MTDGDLLTVFDLVTSIPDKSARWYAKRLGWPGERVSRALAVLTASGHLKARRATVYRPAEREE